LLRTNQHDWKNETFADRSIFAVIIAKHYKVRSWFGQSDLKPARPTLPIKCKTYVLLKQAIFCQNWIFDFASSSALHVVLTYIIQDVFLTIAIYEKAFWVIHKKLVTYFRELSSAYIKYSRWMYYSNDDVGK
jgi:hypothetical protein